MKRLLLLGLVIPAVLFGQKREDVIISLQRDVADLQERMKNMQKSQDDKFAAILGMLQQAADASGRAATTTAALQKEIEVKLNEQQTKVVGPVVTLGSKVDELATEFRSVSITVADLQRNIKAQDSKLGDISSAIRALAAAQTAPPAPAVAQTPASPCTGQTSEGLWEKARRDKATGKLDDMLGDYALYAECFHESANAPVAQYEIGSTYLGNKQYDEAVKAFDAVLVFPQNPKTSEALYFKAFALMKSGRSTEAGKGFKEYIATYRSGEHVAMAHTNLKTLGMEAKGPTPKKR
jgi:TolA-binding protein